MRWTLVVLLAGCRDDLAPAPDGAVDPGVAELCVDSCRETALTASFQTTRVLDHAVFGVTPSTETLHVEVYRGSDGMCPSETSPTPDYTLVLGKVARPTATAPTSSPGNVLDFVGDLLGGALGAQASIVTVRAVAAREGEFVALDVALEFQTGTVDGHLFATHCPSLDSP